MKRSGIRLLIASSGLALTALVVLQGAKLVQVGLYNHQTEEYLSFWERKQQEQGEAFSINPRHYEIAINSANRGIAALPHSAEQYRLKNSVIFWAGHTFEPDPHRLTPDVDQNSVLENWEAAITLRPAWPYFWSDYSVALAQQSLINDVFEAAIIRADQLGSWEPQILENNARSGLHYKGWLSQSTQAVLDESLNRLGQVNPHQAEQLSKAYQRDAL